MTNPNESTGQPEFDRFLPCGPKEKDTFGKRQRLKDKLKKRDAMKDESTGQQQLEEWFDEKSQEYAIRAHQAHIDPDEFYRSGLETGYFKGYHDAESLSRWREIAVDGLPGDEYKTKWIEFVDMTENFYDSSLAARMILWRQDMGEVFLRAEFTHWRQIDLPTP